MYMYIYTRLDEHVLYIALKDAKCGNCKRLSEFCSSLKTGAVVKIPTASDTFENNCFTS